MIKKEEKRAVPKGIRYLSDWEGFSLSNLPDKCILNKQLPGCGFTEYCINGPENVILCSPRKVLLQNKADQHKGEVYHVINKLETKLGHDKSLTINKRERPVSSIEKAIDRIRRKTKLLPDETHNQFETRVLKIYEDEKKSTYRRIYDGISEYCRERTFERKPIKILVTYDSYRIVLSTLRQMNVNLDGFYTIVDEMQSMGQDARFKPEIEMDFFHQLDSVKHVCYASATPMMEDYLNMIEEFDGLPYIELDWVSEDPGRIVRPDLKVRTMKSTYTAVANIIQSYLSGNFERTYKKNEITGEIIEVESKEAVFYVNSVSHILNIIFKNKLAPDQVNILCADTDSNVEKILKKLGKSFSIGNVPKKGEPHKMFTLCTRTVYLGVDFYSDNARTFIFSDSNLESLAVDISEDLPQILGRQRNGNNPWKSSAMFYYIPLYKKNVKLKEIFDNIVAEKKYKTRMLLSAYGKVNNDEQSVLGDKFVDSVMYAHYARDYVTLKGGKAVTNYLVLANELRAFKLQQLDYKDRASVFARIAEEISPSVDYNIEEVEKFMQEYEEMKLYYERLRFLCESSYELSEESLRVILDQLPESDIVKAHFVVLGRERCKALGYNITHTTRELGKLTREYTEMIEEIVSSFKIGEKYLLSYIKAKLIEIYKKHNYPDKPTAKDIEQYFEVRMCKVNAPESLEARRQKAYKILSRL